MSSPRENASISSGSSDMWARTRSSIWAYSAAIRLQPLKQDFAELLGRVDVERAAREVVDLAGELEQLALEHARHLGQDRRIDAHAVGFYVRQHRRQRQLDLVVNLLHPFASDLRREQCRKFARQFRCLAQRA